MKTISFLAGIAANIVAVSASIAAPFSTTPTQQTYLTYTYKIAAGGHSPALALPVANRPIHMMAACVSGCYSGIGEVAIMRVAQVGMDSLEWVGSDFASAFFSGMPSDSGQTGVHGFYIMYVDGDSKVLVQVNSAATVNIQNNADVPVTVLVTLTY